MILKQYYLGCLAHASYLIGDPSSGAAAVVDPQRDIQQYLDDAASQGLSIRHVFLTHFHADFVAGHLELAARTGAGIHLGARAEAEYPFTPARDGDVIRLGKVTLSILETPGHTPEGISIVVRDGEHGDTPHAVLTGDTLFVGDVGRPDLLASIGVTADELAGWLYHSLHDKLLELPDATLVYPAHGAGSMCGKNLGKETFTTMGEQRRTNYALAPMSEAEFRTMVTAGQPKAPAYFGYDADLNRRQRSTLEDALATALRPLGIEEVLRLGNAGAQILDTREPEAWAAAHLVDSWNVGLSGKFATWAGSMLDPRRPIVVVAEPGKHEEAATRLGRIGFDRVVGYLDTDPASIRDRPDLVRSVTRLDVAGFDSARAAGTPSPLVVDLRTESERSQGSVPDSFHLPAADLREKLGELPRDRPLLLHCQSGYRSMIALSYLEQQGFRGAMDLRGGFGAWSKVHPEAARSGATCSAS